MNIIEATELKQLKDGIFVVKFWAPWCGPCKTSAPTFDAVFTRMTADFPSLNVATVNADEAGELCRELGVRAIPTVLLLGGGTVQAVFLGMPKSEAEVLQKLVPALDAYIKKRMGIAESDGDTAESDKSDSAAPISLGSFYPSYVCHKKVTAFKIGEIIDTTPEGQESDGSRVLVPSDEFLPRMQADREFLLKHKPEVGGYIVFYKDGYKSYSPAAAFEEGYSVEK